MESNRWWESYFVRYVTGSGVGAIIVHLILKKLGIDLIPCYEELQSTNLVVLGALGFIFCYVASAPIALLHAVRGIKSLKSSKAASSLKPSFIHALTGFDWFFLLALLVMATLGLLLALATYPMLIGLSAASMMVPTFFLWIAVKQYLKSDRDIEWERWYLNLAISRAKDSNAQKEFIESYRHLREHGNAFLIVLLEILLGIVLFEMATLVSAEQNIEHKLALISFIVLALSYWIGAGAVCWWLANRLERFMIKNT